MRGERQDHEFGQSLPDRVALSAAELNGCANEIGATLRIDYETVDLTTREKEESRLINRQVTLAGLDECQLAAPEKVQVTHIGVLHRLTQRTCEEGPGPRRGVSKQGGERVHWD